MTMPVTAVRHHILASLAAVPLVPAQLAQVGTLLHDEIAGQGIWSALLPIAVFLALGVAVERLYWRVTTGFRQRLIAMRLDSVQTRLGAVGRRLAFGLGWVAAFALGSLGAFLLFDWTPLLHGLIARCLLIVVVVWLTTVLLRFILAPGAEKFRILPVSTASARHWYHMAHPDRRLVHRRPDHRLVPGRSRLVARGRQPVRRPVLARVAGDPVARDLAPAGPAGVGKSRPCRSRHSPHPKLAGDLGAGAACGCWCRWAPIGCSAPRWSSWRCRPCSTSRVPSVAHVLRPPGSDTAETVPPLAAVLLDRGLRALWIIGAALLLAWIWEVDVNSMASDATFARVLRGILHAVVILLVIDLLWHVLRTWIDRQLTDAQRVTADATPEAIHRRARMRTLLPIGRNVLLAVLAVMALLMALSALGIEVGPLIAGAGVVGVAIGFGSQTLVKDVISGVFFLLDDAFRVGEYIESGSTRGTVEGFSLRSIKLRHHRGYLHTVPFGSLDKITNYSRDWVIDKVTIGVTYDTDIEKVKRIIKQVGRELQADPALAPHIIETLKMQGIEEYGDFAIKIRLKLTAKPGEQFVIRRRAYGMIKQAFEANGIRFAFPTVQVAGGETGPAAAQAALEAMAKPAA